MKVAAFIRRCCLVVALAVLPVVALAPSAFALDLNTAKAQGLVGERPDGMLGVVGAPTADVQALVADVNARRLTLFRKVAADKGQPLATVQAVSGEEFIARTPPGQYVMNASGAWVKK